MICFLSFLLSTELKLRSIHKNKTPPKLILKLQICQNTVFLLLWLHFLNVLPGTDNNLSYHYFQTRE